MIYWVSTKNQNSGLYHYSKKLFENLNFEGLKWIDTKEVLEYKNYPIIYNLGNHKMNSEIYKLAFDYPNYILLHDLNLHFAALSLDDEKYFEGKEKVYIIRNSGVWIDNLEIYSPAIYEILKRQKGIFVHSYYAIEILKMWKINVPVYYIPMGTETFKNNFEKIPYSIGIFGHRGINRNLKKTSKIILKLKELFPQMKLVICGGGTKEGLEELDFAEYYENLPSKEFYDILSKMEILFNYRFPVYGETSLSTLEAMAREVIPIVSSYGSYNELDGAIKVRELENSIEEINKLWESPLLLNTLSKKVKEFVSKNNSIKIWAQKWKEFLCGLKK